MNKDQAHFYGILIWLIVLGLISYESYKYTKNQMDQIDIRFRTLEEIINANP